MVNIYVLKNILLKKLSSTYCHWQSNERVHLFTTFNKQWTVSSAVENSLNPLRMVNPLLSGAPGLGSENAVFYIIIILPEYKNIHLYAFINLIIL